MTVIVHHIGTIAVKLSLFLRTLPRNGLEMKVKVHEFLTSTLWKRLNCQLHAPAALNPGREFPVTIR